MLNFGTKISGSIREWGQKRLNEERQGGLLDWTPETARQFKHYFDTDIEHLLHDRYFLGLRDIKHDSVTAVENGIYPAHKDDILAIYEENKKRPINLVVFVEGIGSGKSTKCSVITWLEWFKTTCQHNPQGFYGMMDDEIIAFISMNRSESQAKRVTLQKIFPKFQTPFNNEYFPPSKRRGQEIWIPRNNTLVFAGTSSAASALGYNVKGGIVDEANFLEVTEGGKKSQSAAGKYDAAKEMHDAIMSRMRSRFISPITGLLDGMLFMISSSRYPDDFLEQKIKEHLKLGEKSHIFFRRRTLWEAKPKWYFSGIKVPFDLKTKKVLADDETIEDLKFQAEQIRIERIKQRAVDEAYDAAIAKQNKEAVLEETAIES
jgi:hypothetical protein